MKKLSWRKPLYAVRTGDRLDVLHRYPNGNLVVSNEDFATARTVDAFGYSIVPKKYATPTQIVTDVKPKPPKLQETVEFLSLYPTGQVYSKSCCPVKHSSYGVENLIQIKVTRRGGRIVKKEFV